jgi:hypothetical protein
MASRDIRPPRATTYRLWNAAQNTGMRKPPMRARNASVVKATRRKNETLWIIVPPQSTSSRWGAPVVDQPVDHDVHP